MLDNQETHRKRYGLKISKKVPDKKNRKTAPKIDLIEKIRIYQEKTPEEKLIDACKYMKASEARKFGKSLGFTTKQVKKFWYARKTNEATKLSFFHKDLAVEYWQSTNLDEDRNAYRIERQLSGIPSLLSYARIIFIKFGGKTAQEFAEFVELINVKL
jgi:hypothetical protein